MGIILKYFQTGKILYPAVFLFIVGMFPSCGDKLYETDVSGQELEIDIKRFEQDLFQVNLDSITENLDYFYSEYGKFFDLFNYRIIQIGGARQLTYPDYLKTFLTDYLNHEVYKETMKIFPDLDVQEDKLADGFKRFRFHFPGRELPEIYSFISRFNQSIVTDEGILGIGLDNYLGVDNEFYLRLGKHQYQIDIMYPGKIASDCMMGWGMTEFEFNDLVDNVLSNMIYHGKMACFTKWMLPEEADSVIMGFSAGQMNFCLNNEATMWEYLVEHKLLFETDRMSILKFTGNGPFTRDFTHESPARAAVWLGWRIVEEYMKRNPKVTLSELMADQDYQKILTLSKYNP